jgi:hypothetical protein
MTPKVENGKLVFNTEGLKQIPTVISFNGNTIEVTTESLKEELYLDRMVDDRSFICRNKFTEIFILQILKMETSKGKMTVVRLSCTDKDYLFFPDKP